MSNASAIPSSALPAESDAADLQTLFTSAVAVPLTHTGWIRVSGEDRVRWLNGMVTNSVVALAPGQGCYNFLLNAQGRIQGTAWAFAKPESLLLETDRAQVEPLLALLDRFIIMDDVELADVSADFAGLLLAGPHALTTLERLGVTTPKAASPSISETTWHGEPFRLISKPGRLLPTWELWSTPAAIAELAAATGLLTADPIVLDQLRMIEGTPRFGADIRERELPQETGQTEALHFSKGCYLGQEIVERIRSRGNVHRTFHGFRLSAPLPAGTPIEAAGKPVGELTSIAELPAFSGFPVGITLALGYIRREALDLGHPLTAAGTPIEPLALPLRPAETLRHAPPAHPTDDIA